MQRWRLVLTFVLSQVHRPLFESQCQIQFALCGGYSGESFLASDQSAWESHVSRGEAREVNVDAEARYRRATWDVVIGPSIPMMPGPPQNEECVRGNDCCTIVVLHLSVPS